MTTARRLLSGTLIREATAHLINRMISYDHGTDIDKEQRGTYMAVPKPEQLSQAPECRNCVVGDKS